MEPKIFEKITEKNRHKIHNFFPMSLLFSFCVSNLFQVPKKIGQQQRRLFILYETPFNGRLEAEVSKLPAQGYKCLTALRPSFLLFQT